MRDIATGTNAFTYNERKISIKVIILMNDDIFYIFITNDSLSVAYAIIFIISINK